MMGWLMGLFVMFLMMFGGTGFAPFVIGSP